MQCCGVDVFIGEIRGSIGPGGKIADGANLFERPIGCFPPVMWTVWFCPCDR